MPNKDQLGLWLFASLPVFVMLVRLYRQEPVNHTDLLITLIVIFILFGHRLPSLLRHLGNGPPGGFC